VDVEVRLFALQRLHEVFPRANALVRFAALAEPDSLKSFDWFAVNAMFTTVGPATPGGPTWKCALLMPDGRLKMSITHDTVWVSVFNSTLATPNAPVSTIGVSLPPVSVEVKRMISA
jgi:hypothetical protein